MSKDFFIDQQKEQQDIEKLYQLIKDDGWVDGKTIIVVCSPEYSSIICQILCHRLSYLNNYVPMDLEFLEMPYPGGEEFTDKQYERHINSFAKRVAGWVNPRKLLFVDSGVLRGQNFTTLKRVMNQYMFPELMKYACVYKQADSIFEPDYCVETFDFEKDGGLTFWWEDPNNPYWGW